MLAHAVFEARSACRHSKTRGDFVDDAYRAGRTGLPYRLERLHDGMKHEVVQAIGWSIFLLISWRLIVERYRKKADSQRKIEVVREKDGAPLPGPTNEKERLRSDLLRWKHDTRGLVDKYGKVYRTYNGPDSSDLAVALADPDAIALFYKGDGREHGKEVGMGFGDYFARLYGSSLGILEGDDWQRVKKVFTSSFTLKAVERSLQVIQTEISSWVEGLSTSASATKKTESSFELMAIDSTLNLPLKVISVIMYSELMDSADFEEETSLIPLHEGIIHTAISDASARSRWLRLKFWDERNSNLRIWEKKWHAFNLKMVEKARKLEMSSMVERTYRSVESHELSIAEWLQTLDEILLTNIDVTSGVMAWNLTFCALYPDAQHRLFQEIEEQTRLDLEAYLSSSTTLLHSFCVETSRVRPAFAYALPETIAQDKSIGGYFLPKGTTVIIDAWGLNTSGPLFNDRPKSFVADRHMSLDPQQVRQQYWRFGLGPRQCLGYLYADRAIKLLLIELLTRYRVELGSRSRQEAKGWTEDVLKIPVDPDKHINTPLVHLRYIERSELEQELLEDT